MATLRARKDRGGKYELDYYDLDGHRYRLDTGTTDPTLAKLWKQKAEERLSMAKLGMIEKVGKLTTAAIAGREEIALVPTLEEYREKYEVRCRSDYELSAGTIELTNLAFRSLGEVVGNPRLDELTDEDILRWKVSLLKRGRAKSTVGAYYRHLRSAFNRATKHISDNPFLQIEEPKEKRKKKVSKGMTQEHVRQLLAAVEAAGEIQFAQYLRFLLYTACRRGEILQLRGRDVDVENRILTVQSEKTKRELELPVNKALERLVLKMNLVPDRYLFPSNSNAKKMTGQPWHEDFVSHRFKRYIRDLKLPDRYTLHSLRHSYSNCLLEQGVSLEIVYKLLGHSSIQTTSKYYDATMALNFREQADLVDFEG